MYDPKLVVKEFQQHTGRRDGLQVVASLRAGLDSLSELMYARLHEDVRKVFGADSMLVPVSEMRSLLQTRAEIGLYQIAESAAIVRQLGYWPIGKATYMPWLAGIVLGEPLLSEAHRQAIDAYMSKPDPARRLAFTDVLAKVLPESRRAPLVLFLLFPLAVQIATAQAFGDHPTADQQRTAQVAHLPVIAGCHHCQGRVLENGETCPHCGNPLWKIEWLTSVE